MPPAGDEERGIFLMHDCGVSLHKSEEFQGLQFPMFLTLFQTLRNEILSVSGTFLHGDALPHNLVYNKYAQKLVLIDLDEGTFGTSAHKRVIEQPPGDNYEYLRYPNFLRSWRNRRLYTDIQLAASLLLLSEAYFVEAETTGNDARNSIRNLGQAAEAVNSYLKRHNDDDPHGAYGNAIPELVHRLVELLEETLQ